MNIYYSTKRRFVSQYLIYCSLFSLFR